MIVFAMLDHAVPSGGVRVVYAMADALVGAGRDAVVWHAREGFRPTWFENETRVVTGAERCLQVGDVLVVPEIAGRRYQRVVAQARVVIVNQRHSFTILGHDPPPDDDPSPYPGWPNCAGVVATSEAVDRFVRALTGDRVPVVAGTVLVDEDFFTDRPKRRLITATVGRRPDDVAALRHLLARCDDLPAGWDFRVVGGLSKPALAEVLAETAVFVSTADHDGFSLPGAEALAAGCDVVGFHGDGAREYMLPEFTTVVDDPDLLALRDAVVAAAREFDEEPTTYARRRAAGRRFVRERYAREVFEQRTVAAFEGLLARGVGQDRPVTVRHLYGAPTTSQRVRSLLRRPVGWLSRVR